MAENVESSILERAIREAAMWEGSRYFSDAEKWTPYFWDADKVFLPMFEQLTITHLLELACGHGRHADPLMQRFGDRVETYVMMDVLASNIDFCRSRHAGMKRARFLVNAGAAYDGVASNSLTAIFCYDAMVHFHRDVVRQYLVDTKRVLIEGGRALFHHSNNGLDPDSPFDKNVHGRAYLSAALFRKYAEAAGLTVLEQRVIDWVVAKDLDCVTLVEA